MIPAVNLDGIEIHLRHGPVIEEFSAAFAPGDFAALLGCNGSGKTTILRAIMGFVRLTRGRISLFGELAGPISRARAAYVPQAPAIDYKMPVSVRDVVAMGRYGARGLGRRLIEEDRLAVENALGKTGLTHLAERPVGHLSGGERQKMQLARALCQAPDVLLLDEPTANLDLGAQRECLDLIEEIHAAGGMTVVIVMHDLQALPRRCERAVIIDGGRKVFDGDFAGVFTRANLSHIYKKMTDRVIGELIEESGRKRLP
jgi:ABC-type Mn2+/Zn2+ transport system ATPase subunit